MAALAWPLVSATPALAHATLTQATPAQNSRTDTAPRAVRLAFTESVDLSSRSMEVLDSDGRRVDVGDPFHPSGDDSSVAVALTDDLLRGTYTVVWRVSSADSHPVANAYSFGFGVTPVSTRATLETSPSVVVTVAHGVARFLALSSALALFGGTFFLTVVWPAGRRAVLARSLVHRSWFLAVVAAAALLVIQGPYGASTGLTGLVDPELLVGTATTRYGELLLLRLALLACAAPILRDLFRSTPPHRAVLGGLGTLFVFTFAYSEHSGQGNLAVLAVPSDMAHTAAASIWLGGLFMLLTAVLRRTRCTGTAEDLLTLLPRWTRIAVAAVGVLVVTGSFQAWREVRYSNAIVGTGYGRLLIGKILLVTVMLASAATARAVARRLASPPSHDVAPTSVETTAAYDQDIVTSPDQVAASFTPERGQRTSSESSTATQMRLPAAGPATREHFIRALRRRVVLEAALGLLVLVVTAVLVNTIPAKDTYDIPFSARVTAKDTSDSQLPVIIDIDSTRVGLTTMHVYAYTSYGDPLQLASASASLANAAAKIAPTPVDLPEVAVGHVATDVLLLPSPGDWTVTVDLLTDSGASLVATTRYRVRG
ncbi:copper resistance CopC/CopD family protein [Kineosporia sp. R_H_3]|uniref:copper resistance CopC/CopD family protein n=1 Tax=Kineosporia sp. R_H_3 TaxID=1961848 RepID=UPI001304169D|nr:copper resistance protein CopC [Kineosporia sp. R_H_3]